MGLPIAWETMSPFNEFARVWQEYDPVENHWCVTLVKI